MAKVRVDQRVGELQLPARKLEPVRLELIAVGVALVQRLPLCDEHANRFLQALELAPVGFANSSGVLDARLAS